MSHLCRLRAMSSQGARWAESVAPKRMLQEHPISESIVAACCCCLTRTNVVLAQTTVCSLRTGSGPFGSVSCVCRVGVGAVVILLSLIELLHCARES